MAGYFPGRVSLRSARYARRRSLRFFVENDVRKCLLLAYSHFIAIGPMPRASGNKSYRLKNHVSHRSALLKERGWMALAKACMVRLVRARVRDIANDDSSCINVSGLSRVGCGCSQAMMRSAHAVPNKWFGHEARFFAQGLRHVDPLFRHHYSRALQSNHEHQANAGSLRS